MALSFLLLFGAGLFVRSLQNLKTTDTGFHDMDNLVTFQLSPALLGYDAPRVMHFYQELRENIRAIPNVKSAAFVRVPLLHGWEWDSTLTVEGHQAKDGEDMQAFMNSVSPEYFRTMGIPLLEGRDFDDRDVKEKPDVAIVNSSFARHYFGDHGAIGRRIGRGDSPDTKLDIQIVGVVADSLYEGPREGVHRQAFVPNYGNGSVAFYVRISAGSESAYKLLRNAVAKLDSSMPLFELKTLEAQLDEILLTERLIALLSAGFGFLATLLAAIGLYGVMSFVVARRTKELGVRLALGAQRSSVLWLVMQEVLLLLGIGIAAGLPAGFGLGRFVASQLYGIQAGDPAIAATTIMLLATVSIAAGIIPAHRASRIDPIRALRYE